MSAHFTQEHLPNPDIRLSREKGGSPIVCGDSAHQTDHFFDLSSRVLGRCVAGLNAHPSTI